MYDRWACVLEKRLVPSASARPGAPHESLAEIGFPDRQDEHASAFRGVRAGSRDHRRQGGSPLPRASYHRATLQPKTAGTTLSGSLAGEGVRLGGTDAKLGHHSEEPLRQPEVEPHRSW